MQIRFELAPDGGKRAVTEGLSGLGQSECVLPLTSEMTEEAAAHVLNYIANYVKSSGQRILPGETMPYGWSTLRFIFAAGTPNLQIEELAEPLSSVVDAYIPGAWRAIAIRMRQDETVRRNGIATASHHPHRSEFVITCRRISPITPPPVIVLDRLKTRRRDESGWFAGCGDAGHNHRAVSEMTRLHLIYLAELEPRIVPYLAMPEDSRIVFEQRRVITFAPGQQEGQLDALVKG